MVPGAAVYLQVWNIFQATPLGLSLKLSLHMWLCPCGSISRSTHSNTTGAWCPAPDSDALGLPVAPWLLTLKSSISGLIINFLVTYLQSLEF